MKNLEYVPSPLPCGVLNLTPQGKPSPARDRVVIRHARVGGHPGVSVHKKIFCDFQKLSLLSNTLRFPLPITIVPFLRFDKIRGEF